MVSPHSKGCATLILPAENKVKTVRDSCELQPNALSIKLSDQIEQLDQLITAEGDGTDFFEKTKITQGMQTSFVRASHASLEQIQRRGRAPTARVHDSGLVQRRLVNRRFSAAHR